jgi:hypothetical protein
MNDNCSDTVVYEPLIARQLDELYRDPTKYTAWMRECRAFEDRGCISEETDQILNLPHYAV